MDFKKFDKGTIIEYHGDMYKYRDLYEGNHAPYSKRATDLIDKGEIVDVVTLGAKAAMNVQPPYLIFNVCKAICDIPAYFVSGAISEIKSSLQGRNIQESDELTEGDDEVEDIQQATIDQITNNSKLHMKHKSLIVQHQIDGGIVGVPVYRDGKISLQFKERNVYYPHEDDLGADLWYELNIYVEEDKADKDDYMLKHTERLVEKGLEISKQLYRRQFDDSELELVEDISEIEEVLGEGVELYKLYEGKQSLNVQYWGNETTLMNPLGVSAIKGQENKQEEVNWTITRMGLVLERNGKPRISVTRAIMDNLKKIAKDRYGNENKIDYRDLGVTEMDSDGNSIVVHTLDLDSIGNMEHVKEVVRMMLAETKTSEQALDILNASGTGGAQSGVAKFYDMLFSIIKANQLIKEYTNFLQDLYESALWLVSQDHPNVEVERPYIMVEDIIPTPKKEQDENALAKRNAESQSLEETVRELHPNKTDEWVDEEVARIQDERASDDTSSLNNVRQNLQGFMNNRNPAGRPLNQDGTERINEEGDE